MAIYECTLCGELYDEEKEGVRFEDLPDDWKCPLCGSPKSAFVLKGGSSGPKKVREKKEERKEEKEDVPVKANIELDPKLLRNGDPIMDTIRTMSYTGKSPGDAMETQMPVPNFDDILFLGAQLSRTPLDDDSPVSLKTVIGKNAKRPMVIDTPVFISHMSFGALSGRAKTALAIGATMAGTAMCSGEGGALYDEMINSDKYIFEYIPNKYSFDGFTLEHCDAIEIKIGQGTKPGMGGHLPGDKVDHIIATMRGKPVGVDVKSPSHFPEIGCPEDLKAMVDMLRSRGDGIPVGVKIAAGHIEEDLEFIKASGCDFITIDGRGGATGSSPKFLRDASSVPTVYALSRARKFMDENNMTQELVITGGFRTSGDVAKAIAMGADAVAMASAPLMALGCQRYRICGSGRCPMGIATQDPELQSRLDIDTGSVRVANFLKALSEELRVFSRVSGHEDIHDLSLEDLCTIDSEISVTTGIRHA